MGEYIDLKLLVNAVVFSLFGIIIFWLALFIWDKVTPFKMWTEIVEKQNVALAILIGSVIMGLSLIVAFAHG